MHKYLNLVHKSIRFSVTIKYENKSLVILLVILVR